MSHCESAQVLPTRSKASVFPPVSGLAVPERASGTLTLEHGLPWFIVDGRGVSDSA